MKTFDEQLYYWTHMLDESMGDKCSTLDEADKGFILVDSMIDDSTVEKWSCFTDENVKKLIAKLDESDIVNEDGPMSGAEWRKLPFWKQVRDYVMSGTNYDGSPKGWFEDRKFPIKVIKDEDMTAKNVMDALRAGFNIKRDSSTATPEQQKAAGEMLWTAFDANFLASYDKAMQDAGDVAGMAGAAYGYAKDGAAGAAVGGVGAKAAVTKYSDAFVQQFNDTVKGTRFEDLSITQEDVNRSWFERVLLLVTDHPFITIAAVIALVALWKNRQWIWDRIKLGFNNLWQGKVIAKYEFQTTDGVEYKFEYDLRFNKWRLLFGKFQWRGNAFPGKTTVESFMKTQHCLSFISECANGFQNWIDNEDKIREITAAASKDERDQAKAIIEVLDDKDDILNSMKDGKYKIG